MLPESTVKASHRQSGNPVFMTKIMQALLLACNTGALKRTVFHHRMETQL